MSGLLDEAELAHRAVPEDRAQLVPIKGQGLGIFEGCLFKGRLDALLLLESSFDECTVLDLGILFWAQGVHDCPQSPSLRGLCIEQF